MMTLAGLHERQSLLVPGLAGHTPPANHDSQTHNAIQPDRLQIQARVLQSALRLSSWPRLPFDLRGPPPSVLAHDDSQCRWPLLANHNLVPRPPLPTGKGLLGGNNHRTLAKEAERSGRQAERINLEPDATTPNTDPSTITWNWPVVGAGLFVELASLSGRRCALSETFRPVVLLFLLLLELAFF